MACLTSFAAHFGSAAWQNDSHMIDIASQIQSVNYSLHLPIDSLGYVGFLPHRGRLAMAPFQPASPQD